MLHRQQKILILRFSSFGDVTQALSIPSHIKNMFPNSEVHWAVRADLKDLLWGHPHIDKVHLLDRKLGFSGLCKLILLLNKEKFTHVYDAHNNLRSHLISWGLRPPLNIFRVFNPPEFIRKSQFRLKRFLLFKFRKNTYEMPFSGQRDLLKPLTKWGIPFSLPEPPQIFIKPEDQKKAKDLLTQNQMSSFVALAPSAAFPLKRWPLEYWKKLVLLESSQKFVVLGGPEDSWTQELQAIDPLRILNLAGRLSLGESAAVVEQSQALIANDTGLLHVGEQLGKSTIALMGPAPFGFPSRKKTRILQLALECRPCSKHGQGPCVNSQFQLCLVGISPEKVQSELTRILK
ncbi:MAG: glycosyltransferase family 9 protein [Pseudobdellovibrionaceae bacterium]